MNDRIRALIAIYLKKNQVATDRIGSLTYFESKILYGQDVRVKDLKMRYFANGDWYLKL